MILRTQSLAAALLLPTLLTAAADMEFLAGDAPQDIAIADFNADGLQDIAVATAFDDTVSVWLQQLGGTFSSLPPVQVGSVPFHPFNFPRSFVVHDVNHDGFPDLTVQCSGNFLLSAPPSVQTLLNRSGEELVPLEAVESAPAFAGDLFPVDAALADVTGNGADDLIVAQSRDASLRIMEGDGTGRWSLGNRIALPAGAAPEEVTALDWNGDMREDLLVLSPDGLHLLLQVAPGVFSTQAIALPVPDPALRGSAIDDFDLSGAPDIALADAGERLIVLYDVAADGSYASSRIETLSSGGEPTDVIAVQHDADGASDIAVSTNAPSVLTVFNSGGTSDDIAVPPFPVRLAAGDLNQDGLLDLAAVHLGDQANPGNSDVSIRITPVALPGHSADWVFPLGDSAGVQITGAQGFALANPALAWLTSADRSQITSLNLNANANASPQTRGGSVIDFGFEVGGVVFTGPQAGYVLERDAPVIRPFTVTGGAGSPVGFAATPGGMGFSALAFDEDANTFYAVDPAENTIHHAAADGTLLNTWTPPWPVSAAVRDGERDLLATVSYGSGIIRFLDAGGTWQPALDTDTGARGLMGITASATPGHLLVLNQYGLVLDVDPNTGSIEPLVAAAPGTSVVALAWDEDGQCAFALGRDGHVVEIKPGDASSTRIHSLASVLEQERGFRFGGLEWDAAASEFLVADAESPRVARFQSNGSFLGLQPVANFPAGLNWTGGLALDRDTGSIWYRHFWGAVDEAGLQTVIMPSGPADFAVSNGIFASRLTAPGLAAIIDPGAGTISSVSTASSAPVLGIALNAAGSMLLYAEQADQEDLRLVPVPGAGASVSGWQHW